MESKRRAICGHNTSSQLRETGERSGFVVERGNGFHQSRNRERVPDAPLAAEQAQAASGAGKGDGVAHQRRYAGAVNLLNVAEIDEDFVPAVFGEIAQLMMQAVARLADGDAAAGVEDAHIAGFANRDIDAHFGSTPVRLASAPRPRGNAHYTTVERHAHRFVAEEKKRWRALGD